MLTTLVTGASGFIGHHLCNKLYENGYQVIGIGSKEKNQPKCHKFFQMNLMGIPLDLIPDIDICFHQGANNLTIDLDKVNMLQANFFSPMNLFYRLVREKKCKKFIYASSCSVYGNQPAPFIENITKIDPLNPYAESKVLFENFAESFALENNVNTIGLRYSNVYGPGEDFKGSRASMIHQLLNTMSVCRTPRIFKHGEQLRDWVYIEDIIQANLLAVKYPFSGVFNVGAGESMSFNAIIETINDILGTKLIPEYINCKFKERLQSHTLTDLSHASENLKYFPKYKIVEGIKKFVETKKP